MNTVEIQGRTLEEAKSAAAEKLGVPVGEIEVDSVEEIKGLFGKAAFKIKASVRSASAVVETTEAEPPAPKAKAAAKPKAAPKATAKATKTKPAKEPAAPAEEVPAESDTEEPEVEVIATEEDAAQLQSLVEQILDLAHLQATVSPNGLNGKYVNLEIDGKDVNYLVGKHGEVLNALQYLLNLISSRKLGSGARVTLDAGQYRKRREDALQNLAEQIAEQVRSRGEEAVLDALPAFERRVVHKALAEMQGIVTYSEGEEPNRRVVIAPSD